MKRAKYLFMVIFIAVILNTSLLCFSTQKVSSLDDLAKKISGKIVLSLSNDIIVMDLDKKDIFYIVHDEACANYPKWGPTNNTITYFQYRDKGVSTSSQKKDIGDIKINSLDGTKRIIVSNITIFGFEGFDWSNDKKKFAYIKDEGQLDIITDKGEKIESIDLMANCHDTLIDVEQPIFSFDDKTIFFTGIINNGNPPYPSAIYELNLENKIIQKITQKPFIACNSISPDGMKLAYIANDGLYVFNRKTGLEKLLKKLPGTFYNFCSWSPDGSKILYGYPRSFWKMKDPKLEVHMIDITTKEETILIHKELLQQEINIRDLRCRSIDWINGEKVER